MIDRKTEAGIKAIKGFMEFWVKFHFIYKEAISRETISKEDEDKFLETKSMIRSKYEELREGLDFNYMPHSRLTDPVSDLLGIGTIRLMSEKALKRTEDDWRDSFIFLNNILEQLKERRRRFERTNSVGAFFRNVFKTIGAGD